METVEGLRFCLPDGREFRTPSGAGAAITGHASNGFAFWTIAEYAPRAGTAKERRALCSRSCDRNSGV
ncbi:MAG: hypothetical protein M3P30_14775 [Chloroflexota bacterium]|nr:hypothetical protein [Chloroflexota bacterium]